MTLKRISTSLPLLLLLMACSRGEQEGETHVDRAPVLVAEEDLRIGSVNDPDAGFSRIGGATVDTGGSIYVLESQDRQVRVYDDQGQLLRRIGGDGEGPGEFRSPTLIGLQHDTLAIGDLSLGRVTLFLGTGQLLETVPTPPVWLEPAPGFHVMVAPVAFTPDGFSGRIMRMITPPELPRDSIAMPHVALDRSGQVTDTIRFEYWNLYQRQIRVGNMDVSVPSGPSAGPLYIDGPEHTYRVEQPVAVGGDHAEFSVTRLTQAGDTVYHRSIGYRPAGFATGVVDSIVSRAVRPYLSRPGADSAVIAAAIRDAADLPPLQPPVVRGRIGSDDVLWLQLYDDGSDRHRWILLDPEGDLSGLVSLPRNATFHWSSDEQVLVVVHDELDVPWLVRYRLRRDDGQEERN